MSTRRNGQERLGVAEKPFPAVVNLDTLTWQVKPIKKYGSFRSQPTARLEDGTYCTKLPWKPDHASLPSNKELTVGRLRSVT